MALPTVVNSLDDFSDEIKQHYRAGTAEEKAEGRYVLDGIATDGFAVENVQGLKGAYSSTQEKLKKAKDSLDAFKFQDGDQELSTPEDISKALQELANLRTSKSGKDTEEIRKELERNLKDQLGQQHQAELEKLTGSLDTSTAKVDSLLEQLESHVVSQDIQKAILENGGDAKTIKLISHHVRQQLQLDTAEGDDGKFKFGYKVIDSNGVPRITLEGSNSTDPMQLKELVSLMKKDPDYAIAFPASGKGGTGTNTGATRQMGGAADLSNLPPAERRRLARQNQ